MNDKPYTIYGYKGKQVRDQIHSYDVANLFLQFYENPRFGEVYNLGGGRSNSLSILETVSMLKDLGVTLSYEYSDQNRVGDHICYISDLTKVKSHFPKWELTYGISRILEEIVQTHQAKATSKSVAGVR